MASDDIIWDVINQQFCSFKLKAPKGQKFCRNEYNVTGVCSRQACPLANSRYATVRADPDTGRLYLFMKTVERAHLPSKLWEKIRLAPNYAKALKQIDERLLYWPKFLNHRCKQRLTRLMQVNMRMRRIAKEDEQQNEQLVAKLAPKIRTREKARERKAEAAAQLEKTTERQLLERLRSGTYGEEPLNVSEAIWKKVLKTMENKGQGVRDKDMDKGIAVDENGHAVEDDDYDDSEEDGSEEDDDDSDDSEEVQKAKKSKARQTLDIEEDDLTGHVEYVSDFEESEDEVNDIEDWIGMDSSEESDEEPEEDSDDSDGTANKKKRKAGDKRKRGRVVRMAPKKKKLTQLEYAMPAAEKKTAQHASNGSSF